MQIYLPIAEISVNAFYLLLMGGGVGYLSGLLGVGGGFLMTPLLMFIGIPPAVAVGTQANQLIGASVAGVMVHWRRRNVDVRMALVMLCGSSLGTVMGVGLFALMKRLGHIDLLISLSYFVLLGTLGSLMMWEALRSLLRSRKGRPSRNRLHHAAWVRALPLKMRFPKSLLYISALLPAGIGFVIGLLVAVMGVGGGFLLVPAMIYLLGMPASVVAGTSLLQVIFTTAIAAWLQAAINQTVDGLLALLLMAGGVIGAQLGTRAAGALRGEHARMLLAILILGVALKLGLDLVLPPHDPYSIETLERPS
ncbi:sulfite exporter TauE/SafE family protein [Radicibacter daui]|uniref:sulfite exporter TauE/SafE family protein n=1 Tax=Radicibacter daui TaxID=3064829 RepID=UPI004046EFB6